jgi:membrane peptidoglycan carboxypeptidase
VRLLYGGSDYARQSFNDAVSGAVEAGTALEPFSEAGDAGEPLGKLLRTAAPTPLNLASAYATVAADGRYATPYTVARITQEGRTVYRARPDVRRVLDEEEALTAGGRSGAGPAPAVADDAADPAGVRAFAVAGGGGGIARRTVWATGYDGRLVLTVALFADRAGSRKGTVAPARLPNEPSPTGFARRVAGKIWEAATQDGSTSPPQGGSKGPTPGGAKGPAQGGAKEILGESRGRRHGT